MAQAGKSDSAAASDGPSADPAPLTPAHPQETTTGARPMVGSTTAQAPEAGSVEMPTSTTAGPAATSTLGDAPAPSASRPTSGRGTYVPTFEPGEVVAGRYKVIRYIARGGMGEVYEVEDLDLRGRIALKTVRAEMAVDQAVIERFKREINLARRVTHPNVCRIFDLGRHQLPGTGEGAGGEILFLTMELLEGETLSQRIRRAGALTPEQARSVVRHVAAALTMAHDAEIVHRDFKSSNVMLVPGKGGERAVITDFGIARGVADSASLASVTGTGDMVGTPAYMAPEQVEGGPLTPATDIYALGVVLFEMVTGTLPFKGESSFSVAVKRLREKPPSPLQVKPGLDAVWDSVILRCLERNPQDRFARAEDVTRALESGVVQPPSPVSRRWVKPALVAAVLLALGLVAGLGASLWRARSTVSQPVATAQGKGVATVTARPAVVVLGFRNLGRPEAAWLSTAISEMLRTELAAGGKIRTIPGESVSRMKLELGLADVDSLAPDTLGKIRSASGADYVVLGSYLTVGSGKLRIDLRLQDSAGELLTSSAAEGTEDGLFEIVSRAGAKLRQALALGDLSLGDALAARASYPAHPEAAQLYAEGLAKLRVFDAREARGLLEKAAQRDPTHPLIRSALAAAWSALGYDANARRESKLAVEHANDLPRPERLEVQALDAELSGDWDKAGEMYRALLVFFPDRVDYGLRLSAARVASGKAQEALAGLEDLRRLPEPVRSDPRIDIAEASAAKLLTDHERQLKAAQVAAAGAQKQGAVLLYAQACYTQASALVNLGRFDDARRAAAQAAELFSASGDLGNAARSRNVIAVSHAMRGEFAEARARFQEALEDFRRIGDQRGVATQLDNLAGTELRLGQFAKAKPLYTEALAAARDTGDVALAARILGNFATGLEESGDLAGALRRHEQALAAWREIGSPAMQALTLANIGEVHFKTKRLGLARERLEESLTVSSRAKLRNEDTAWAHGRLGSVLLALGDLVGAERALVEAIAIEREAGAASEHARLLQALSDVHERAGRTADAARARAEAKSIEAAASKD